MSILRVAILLTGAVLVLPGCQSGRATKEGEKALFTVVNHTDRDLTVQPMTVARAAQPFGYVKGKEGTKVAMFESAGKTAAAVSQYALYVIEKLDDIDAKLQGIVRLSPEEMILGEKAGGIKVALEPNKIFVKIGGRTKVYDYLTPPSIGGTMDVPKVDEAPKK